MINSPILDILIVLSFTYFMMSLIITSFNEIVLSLLSKRGKMLKDALENLFFDEEETKDELKKQELANSKLADQEPTKKESWKEFALKNLIKSPHIQSLKRDANSFPSYIPSINFVSAFIDCIRSFAESESEDKSQAKVQLLDMNGIKNVLTNRQSAMPEAFRISLLAMFERSQGDFQKFQKEIEVFYNNAMDRVTGWYKRMVNNYIFCIALIIVAIANVDSIYITHKLWGNPQQLGDMVNTIADDIVNGKIKMDTLTFNEVVSAGKTLNGMGIPMGWNKENFFYNYTESNSCIWDIVVGCFLKVCGWLITVFAIMLGASFWFDLLTKFINIRGSGKKPGDSKPPGDLAQTDVGKSEQVVG